MREAKVIPNPNLDDRTYKEIVDEAIRLIPHYCPEWTNHNPTDPGITMIELFAWMTEMIIYRLNKVPEKNYLTLLDLVGLTPTPPQPAKVLLSFTPVDKYEGEVKVKRGTQVSTLKSETTETVVFETEKNLTACNINLEECISTEDGLVSDNLKSKNKDGSGFLLFSGREEIKRHIYIEDPSIAYLSEGNVINISFLNANQIKSTSIEIVNFLEWEYWNGKKWSTIEYSRSVSGQRKRDNEIYFTGPVDIEKSEIEGVSGFFLRASLINIPDKEQCFEINEVSTKLLFHGEGLNPDLCICNTDNMVYNEIDQSKDFKPFIGIPKYNDAFYIAAEDVLSKEDSEIFIEFRLSDAEDINKPEPKDTLILKYEYWNGRNWIEIGTTSTKGVKKSQGNYNFTDSTNATTKSGEVKFIRPGDLTACEVNGQMNHWIRIRIGAGDFGTGGQYIFDDDGKWNWVYDKPVSPPVLNRIRLRYLATKKPVRNLLSYYDFSYFNFTEKNQENYLLSVEEDDKKAKFFNIFEINKEKCPITYLGLNRKFPEGSNSIYFRINEKKKALPERSNLPDQLGLAIKKGKRAVSLKWEYWDGSMWKLLSVNDYTDHFHQSGFIEFNSPEDMVSKSEFGKNLYWIRLIHESGSFEINPRILAIELNSTYAYNQHTYKNELLGSSNGAPSQEFNLLHWPVLPGIEVVIRESEVPPSDEREMVFEEEGENAIQIMKNPDGKDEVWIRYHQVPNFYVAGPKSRHYVIDYLNNKIIFGNGTNGIIPPRLKNNVKVAIYRTGGSSHGNVGYHTVSLLRENIPYIAGVNNPYSAEGGADLEDLESLKARATNIFKNLNRAVTAEDYEWLSREASSSVARAKCLSKPGKNGEVVVLIVPRPDSSDIDLKSELHPTSELLRRVKEFLGSRKLVGTRLKVEAPVYVKAAIIAKVVFKKEISDIQVLKDQVELEIRRFLNPIVGGPDGNGWPFGVPLAKNDIYGILEKIDGVYYIEDIELINDETGVSVEKIELEEDNLIYLSKVNIQERRIQF